MKNCLMFLCCAGLLAATAAPRPDAEAAAMLREMAEKGKNFAPASGRTAIFARAQLKYGLERDDYLHHWVDRPLFQDSAYLRAADGNFLNPKTWEKMHMAADLYKMDGYAFFPLTKNRSDLFRAAATPGLQVTILPEITSAKYLLKKGASQKAQALFDMIETALKSNQAYRINGKLLITTYPADTESEQWVELKKLLTDKYGDRFLIAPMHQLPVRIVRGKAALTAADVNELRELIRERLRHVDGYYYNHPPLDEFRRYDGEFDRQVMIPLLTSILSEPEFKGKLLVWGTKVGHENFYAKGSFTYNCGGTSMLRGSVGSAVAARADVINLVEWDEENENTSFRPTLYNSFSTQRIVRALSGLAKGRLFPRQEGDDGSVPNLILSYRKILVAGETLELEVVNVPEAESKGKVLHVELLLKDAAGKVVRSFSGELADDKLAELRFNVKVADVLDHHILIPELIVDGRSFTSGFTPVELRANWNGDNKWVKQPLRDLAPCRTELKIAGTTPDGWVKITGKVESATPLHSVELVDSGDPVYQHKKERSEKETDGRATFSVIVGGYGYRDLAFKGHIKAVNAPSVRYFKQRISGEAKRSASDEERIVEMNADGWRFPGKKAAYGFFNEAMLALSVDRKELEKAELDVDMEAFIPGKERTVIYKGRIKLADILKKRIFATAGIMGTHLILRHTDVGQKLPEALNEKNAEFTVLVDPSLPQSVFFIEIVDKERKTFRSLPVTVYRPSGKTAEFSVFDFFDKKRVEVRCDANLLTPEVLEISPEYGAAVKNSGGHMLTGMMGLSSGLANNLYLMESYGHGNLAEKYFRKAVPDNVSTSPQLVQDADGRWCWKFSGQQNVSFPVCSIYPYSGFELKITFTPEKIDKKPQILVSTGGAGFNLELRRGILTASLYRANLLGSRPVAKTALSKIKAGEKCEVTVRFDQKTMKIVCNGRESKPVECSGYQLYPAELSIGHGVNGGGFHGTIERFELRPL